MSVHSDLQTHLLCRLVSKPKDVAFPITGLPAYSDSAGTMKKCQCKRVSLYPISIRRSFLGQCHCSQTVTLTDVTVSGQAYSKLEMVNM